GLMLVALLALAAAAVQLFVSDGLLGSSHGLFLLLLVLDRRSDGTGLHTGTTIGIRLAGQCLRLWNGRRAILRRMGIGGSGSCTCIGGRGHGGLRWWSNWSQGRGNGMLGRRSTWN